MKRIAIFLSAASLAVTGMISCEKEPDTEAPVPVESVSLDKNALAIVLGIDETKTLTATVYPETATDKTVKWESADPETASVDENGIVIRGLFYKIAEVRWTDIKEITIERLCTYDNRSYIFLRWIIIKLDSKEYVKGRAGRNRKGKSPWCIIASRKNVAIIANYYPSLKDHTIDPIESN